MEQRTKALKTASNIIAILMKIGYIVALIAMCVCVAALIIVAVTGGNASSFTAGGVNFIISDDIDIAPAELIAMCIEYFVMCGFVFAIFLLAQHMFSEISKSGDPFEAKYAKNVRIIGILVAGMTFGIGIAQLIAASITAVSNTGAYTEAPGIVVGAIIFCLSYIIDCGCGLKEQRAAE